MEIFLTVSIILFCGLLGGLYNYYFRAPREALVKPVFAGILAAFLIPLFLDIAQSDLMESITDNTYHRSDNKLFFIFAGFCLIAAISSHTFIRTISSKVLQQLKENNESIDKTREEQKAIKNLYLSDASSSGLPEGHETRRLELDENCRVVFLKFKDSNLKFFKQDTLIESTGLSSDQVKSSLKELRVNELVDKIFIEDHKLWFLTAKGKNTEVTA